MGFRRRLRSRELLAGTVLALITFGPYLVYQARTGYPDLGAVVEGLSKSATTSLASLLVVLDLLQTKGVFVTLGRFAEEWRSASGFWTALDGLAVLLFLLGVGYVIAVAARRALRTETSRHWSGRDRGHVLLVLWVLLPVALFLRHSHHLQNYYFLWVYPAPFVLMVLPLEALFRRLLSMSRQGEVHPLRAAVRRGYPLVYAPIVALGLGQGQIDLAGQEILLSGRPGRQQIRHVSEAIDTSRALLAERPGCTLVVVSDGFNAETSRLALLSESLGPERVRFAAAGKGMMAPDPCALYLAASGDDRSQSWFSKYARPLASATIQTPAETWRFYVVSRDERASLAAKWAREEALGEWAHGLQLLHYEVAPLDPSASELEVGLLWEVARAPPVERYHFFVHLVDGEGGLVSQFDGPGVDSLGWREDDLLWTWFTLPLPSDLRAGGYDIVVGSYEWPSLDRVALSDGRDALIAARIEISP